MGTNNRGLGYAAFFEALFWRFPAAYFQEPYLRTNNTGDYPNELRPSPNWRGPLNGHCPKTYLLRTNRYEGAVTKKKLNKNIHPNILKDELRRLRWSQVIRGPTHITQTNVWVSRGDTLSLFKRRGGLFGNCCELAVQRSRVRLLSAVCLKPIWELSPL